LSSAEIPNSLREDLTSGQVEFSQN